MQLALSCSVSVLQYTTLIFIHMPKLLSFCNRYFIICRNYFVCSTLNYNWKGKKIIYEERTFLTRLGEMLKCILMIKHCKTFYTCEPRVTCLGGSHCLIQSVIIRVSQAVRSMLWMGWHAASYQPTAVNHAVVQQLTTVLQQVSQNDTSTSCHDGLHDSNDTLSWQSINQVKKPTSKNHLCLTS